MNDEYVNDNKQDGDPGVEKEPKEKGFKAWTTRKKTVVIIAAAMALLLLSGGVTIALANWQPAIETIAASEKTSDSVETQNSSVYVTVKIGDAGVVALGKVKVVDGDGISVIEDREVAVNEEVELGSLPEGAYTLHITQAPVHEDNSTYNLPEEHTEFTVEGEGKDVILHIELNRVAVEDMTEEQQAQSAASVEEAIRNNSAAPAANNPSGNTNGNNGSNSSQQWHDALTEQRWIVDRAAWTEQIPIYGSVCNGCGSIITGNEAAHLAAAGRGSACQSWSGDVPLGTNPIHHPEQGHWETVVIREAGWY